VFGAQVYENGRLSDVLRDRMDVAIELYHAGKVQKLLLSGDNRFEYYDEPGQMMDYAIAQGVLAEDIQPDYAGRRSYDTCYRAKHIFEVETAVLITQEFHLYRALMLCRRMGVKSEGVSASLRPYILDRHFALREIPATSLAIWDLLDADPSPVMGERIPMMLK
jgi:SanA protein